MFGFNLAPPANSLEAPTWTWAGGGILGLVVTAVLIAVAGWRLWPKCMTDEGEYSCNLAAVVGYLEMLLLSPLWVIVGGAVGAVVGFLAYGIAYIMGIPLLGIAVVAVSVWMWWRRRKAPAI